MNPEENPSPGLADELRAVERAMQRLKQKPRYDEAELAELLHDYRTGDEDGRALPEIYRRHRDDVLQALEDEGLPGGEADRRVGAVFLRALSREPGQASLRDLLLAEARAVAHDPDWMPF